MKVSFRAFAFFCVMNSLFGFMLGYLTADARCPIEAFLLQSPAVSVTGPRDLPDHPPTPPPVAGADGETG